MKGGLRGIDSSWTLNQDIASPSVLTDPVDRQWSNHFHSSTVTNTSRCFQGMTETFEPALQQRWTAVYTKFLALVLLYGATVHIGNMAGLIGTPWLATPLLWRAMDVALLLFDVTAAIALWRGLAWSVWWVFGGMLLLQFVPYTLFRSQFILQPEDAQTLNGLLGTEALLLGLLALLLWLRK